MDPTVALTAAVDNATKVANTPFFTTIIDKVTGFKISQWVAEGEVRKKLIHDEYEKAKENGIMGIQYISNLRETTNLIDTAVKSAKYIKEGKTNEIKMDNDFFWNTIAHSKNVSNESVQELIAKIIAGEYNAPGEYSMSTLHVIKMLGKSDIKLFQKIISLATGNDYILLPSNSINALKNYGLSYDSILDLEGLGLLHSGIKSINLSKGVLNLNTKNITITSENNKVVYILAFTKAGRELAKTIQVETDNNYFNDISNMLKVEGFISE